MIVGASSDRPEENRKFCDEQSFGFTVLSDVDRRVGERYEVARAGDDQYGPLRMSYLIDPEGVVRRSYRVADVSNHADDVLRDLGVLQPG